jgi:hypothetical protein
MKKKYIFMGILYTVFSCAIFMCATTFLKFKGPEPDTYLNGKPVYFTHNTYAFDMSTPEKAYGVSKYVFIAKVEDVIRTEYVEDSYEPYTIYSASVIKNIKGNLITSEPIELKQGGGISKDGKSYILVEDTKFLNKGNYYLFMVLAGEDGSIHVTNPSGNVDLGSDLNLIKNVLNGTVTVSSNADEKARIENQKIEIIKKNVISIEKAEKPDFSMFIDQTKIPDINNVSKYDINYKKN